MATSSLSDTVFGTRSYTRGAQYQVPRKIPLRIEPKTYFALERTFLSWMSMAVTLGGIMTAVVGFTYNEEGTDESGSSHFTRRTTELITMLLLPLSILMVGYALLVYHFRTQYLIKKQYGFFDDKVGPVVLCVLIMLSLSTIFGLAILNYAQG